MTAPHWILGEETHFGRGYFGMLVFDLKSDALAYARLEYELAPSEVKALRDGRAEFFNRPGRAEVVGCIALELQRCDCETPEVHDG